MPLDDIRAIGRRFREDFWNTGDMAIAEEIFAPGCLVHGRIPMVTDFARGPEALRQLVLFYHLAFSEIRVTAEQIVAEGDTVVVRWNARGRHTGDLLGLPPTHRETITNGIDMLRIEGGKIVEGWVSWDVLSLLEQLLGREGSGVREPETGAGFLALLGRLQ
ncbi:MAG TPA: ester cyclase [Thermoanaerobaculia bacterium]|nr:ester cyclase [Thermoanaerobaculia bacterium]